MVQTNLKNSYCSELYYLLKTGYLIKEINLYHFSDLLINSENCIYQFSQLWVFKGLYLLVIREIYDQIVSTYPNHQKTICFLTCNYYWSKMKNIIHCYI